MKLIKIHYWPVVLMGKPRMTRKDKWHKRKATDSYWLLKDALNFFAKKFDFSIGSILHAIYLLPMPESKSEKWKNQHRFSFHKQKPDTDNITKGIKDSFLEDDSAVAINYALKIWSDEPGIILFEYENTNMECQLDLLFFGTRPDINSWSSRSANSPLAKGIIEHVFDEIKKNSGSCIQFSEMETIVNTIRTSPISDDS